MNSPGSNDHEKSQHFRSPAGCPCTFDITINNGNVFTIILKEANGREFLHSMDNCDHDSYLNLFKRLSSEIGFRIPKNAEPVKPGQYATSYTFKVLLDKNIAPGILYGYGDPAVIKVKEKSTGENIYFIGVTSNDAPNAFPLLRSNDLYSWTFDSYIFPENAKPTWASKGWNVSDYWAPELHKVGQEYRLYYVARDQQTNELCIGLAKASQGNGPYTDTGYPIIKGNVIDPHVFVKSVEEVFLFWKEDNNAIWPGKLLEMLCVHPDLIAELFTNEEDRISVCFATTLWPLIKTLQPMEQFMMTQNFIETVIADYNSIRLKLAGFQKAHGKHAADILTYMRTPIFAQRLSPDGTALEGSPTLIIENDLDWEAHLVEGIWITEYMNRYYLFYAGNDFSTHEYGIGVAVADSLLGPYKKRSGPFLKSSREWWAPGHPSVVLDNNGKYQMLLHAFLPGKAGYKKFRALLSTEIDFENLDS